MFHINLKMVLSPNYITKCISTGLYILNKKESTDKNIGSNKYQLSTGQAFAVMNSTTLPEGSRKYIDLLFPIINSFSILI